MNDEPDYLMESLGYCDSGEVDKAIEIATYGIEKGPENEMSYGPQKADLYSIRSTYFEQIRRYDEAIQDTTKAIEIYADLGETTQLGHLFYSRGGLYQSKMDFQAAIEDFTRAIELDPNDIRPLFFRIKAFLSLKNKAAAREDIAKILDRFPAHHPMVRVASDLLVTLEKDEE